MEDGALELPPNIMRELQKEAGVMAHARHENVVNFMGICTVPPCIITGEHACIANFIGAASSFMINMDVQSIVVEARCTTS